MSQRKATLRPVEDVQRAHDILIGFLAGKVPGVLLCPNTVHALMNDVNLLCWVLHHDHPNSFPKILEELERIARDAGVRLSEVPSVAERIDPAIVRAIQGEGL